ncbi:MAG: hypothetical protein P8Y36_07840 [Alphaproteobacteria bacterium]
MNSRPKMRAPYDNPTDDRLASVELHQQNLETRMKGVERTLGEHSTTLKEIFNAVNRTRNFEPMVVLQFIAYAVAIVATLTGGITYIATASNESRIAVLEFKAEQVWRAGKWEPQRSNTMTKTSLGAR